MKNLITRVKVCCISSVDEALLAIKYGASALGLVSKMPSGPGVISDVIITEIVEFIPPGVAVFLLTSEVTAKPVIIQQKKFRVNTIQLVDVLDVQEYAKMKDAMPGVSLVQVVHVVNEASVDYAVRVSQFVDALLLDSGNPDLKVKELGGTGRVHDWKLSKTIRESIGIPVYLAGGLNSDNVAEAINTVEPFAVDLCSGVRSNGELDEAKLKSFFEKVRAMNNEQ